MVLPLDWELPSVTLSILSIAGFGMSFVMDFITNDQNRFYLQIVGSVMLLCFCLYTYHTAPTRKIHRSGQQKGSIWYNTWTAFLVTFSNPLIVFLFIAMYAQFAFVLPNHPFEMVVEFHEYCRRCYALVVGTDLVGG